MSSLIIIISKEIHIEIGMVALIDTVHWLTNENRNHKNTFLVDIFHIDEKMETKKTFIVYTYSPFRLTKYL